MPSNQDVIREYLVSLGFSIDQPAAQHFRSALQIAALDAERFIGPNGLAGTFVKAGSVIAGTLASIGIGLGAMADHFAQQDLDFKLFARRMFMSEEAAKKMKLATDALGVSIEEIIWGPPELADRYRRLIADQDVMIKNLGGPQFEKAMYNMRELHYQLFQRLPMGLQYLGMQLTKDLVERLLGPDGQRKLDDFVDAFEAAIPAIASLLTDKLVPALEKAWDTLKGIYLTGKEIHGLLTGQGDVLGLWDKNKGINENLNVLVPGLFGVMPEDTTRAQLEGMVAGTARDKYHQGLSGIVAALAVADQESGGKWTTDAVSSKGAQGLMQVMPKNAPGKNLFDPQTNIDVAEGLLFGGFKKYGNWKDAFHNYYGWGDAGPGQPTFDQYWQQIQPRIQEYKKAYGNYYPDDSGASVKPQSYNMDVGGITVNVAHSNASPQDIAVAVRQELFKERQRAVAQLQGVFIG